MLNRVILFFLMFVLLVFSACSNTKKPEPLKQDNQEEVLDDVKIKPGQTIDEYAEQEVMEYNEKTDERTDKYAEVMEESEDEFDIED